MAAKTTLSVEQIDALSGADRNDLCDAADAAIAAGGGFGWLTPPPREVLENFWRGVLLVPERSLFVGRLDGVIGGSAQLVRPTRNNEAQAHAATLMAIFVAPWARGHGLGRAIVLAVEDAARVDGFAVLNLDVRETQTAAIQLYEGLGYVRWGSHPRYARVNNAWVAGYYYSKELLMDSEVAALERST
jgi:ribosomal protein S18 acetylase RimI-like enzyme